MFKAPAVFDSAALTWSATGDAALRGATVRSTPYRWVTLLATLRDAVGSTPATPVCAARADFMIVLRRSSRRVGNSSGIRQD